MNKNAFINFLKLILTLSSQYFLFLLVASAGVYIIASTIVIILLLVIILAIYSRHGAKYYTHEEKIGKFFMLTNISILIKYFDYSRLV